MKMEPIFEWPELSQRRAKYQLEYYGERLQQHERGEIEPPWTSDEETFHRQVWAELNYLANGKVAVAEENCECSECIDHPEWEDDDFEDFENSIDTTPPVENDLATREPSVPVYAIADVDFRGDRIAAEGDDLVEIANRLESDIAYATKRGDRSDAAIMGWTPFIMETRDKLSKVREAIDRAS